MTRQPTRHDGHSAALSVPSPIDPQLRPFVSELTKPQAREANAADLSFDEMRRQAEVVRAPWRRGGPRMVDIEELRAPTRSGAVRVRLYKPIASAALQPALVYLHGGGWTMFSIDTHDRIMRELASRAGISVVGVDYALSPEAKFPFALQQIVDVVRWLSQSGDKRGIDTKRMAIGGDSAGANLAVSTSLMLRDAGERNTIQCMLLIYGCFLGDPAELAATGYGSEGNLLSSREMAGFWENYLADPADARNPLASPLLARLDGLPPAFQVIAQCDVLAEQDMVFAARLRKAGVAAEEREYPGATHSFLEAVSIADVAGRALDDSAAWLCRRLQVSP
ncbi:MAG: alpha/beta hydrolase [Rhodanobacteraceae bacterium]|nr:MAG: alpha/beta hydrolase [Rhodanobacteraceae bacterium]